MNVELIGYAAFFLTTAFSFAIICLGLNLQWGQTGLFNVSTTKVPQTDPSMALLTNATKGALRHVRDQRLSRTGHLKRAGVLHHNEGDLLPLGYYVYTTSMLVQPEADHVARKEPLLRSLPREACQPRRQVD